MATISLYANKVNGMSSLVKKAKSSVGGLKTNLETLQSRILSIDNTICNTDDELKLVQASVILQEDTMTSLGNF